MAITGKDGAVTWATNDVAELTEFSIDISLDTTEITNAGSDSWKEYLATLKGWTGSATANFVGADAAQKAMLTSITGTGAKVAATFTIATGITLAGNVILTATNISAPIADKVSVDYSVQGTGALTPTMPAS